MEYDEEKRIRKMASSNSAGRWSMEEANTIFSLLPTPHLSFH